MEGLGDRIVPATVTIATDVHGTEGVDAGTMTLTRTGDTTAALNVNINVGGTATNGTDYTVLGGGALGGVVTFAANSATAVIWIVPTDDGIREATEDVTVTIVAGAGYDVGVQNSAEVLIFNRPWLVNTTADTVDANPADSRPRDANGNVSLRAAIQQANANAAAGPGTFEIGFADSLFPPVGGGPPAPISIGLTGALPEFTASIAI